MKGQIWLNRKSILGLLTLINDWGYLSLFLSADLRWRYMPFIVTLALSTLRAWVYKRMRFDLSRPSPRRSFFLDCFLKICALMPFRCVLQYSLTPPPFLKKKWALKLRISYQRPRVNKTSISSGFRNVYFEPNSVNSLLMYMYIQTVTNVRHIFYVGIYIYMLRTFPCCWEFWQLGLFLTISSHWF